MKLIKRSVVKPYFDPFIERDRKLFSDKEAQYIAHQLYCMKQDAIMSRWNGTDYIKRGRYQSRFRIAMGAIKLLVDRVNYFQTANEELTDSLKRVENDKRRAELDRELKIYQEKKANKRKAYLFLNNNSKI